MPIWYEQSYRPTCVHVHARMISSRGRRVPVTNFTAAQRFLTRPAATSTVFGSQRNSRNRALFRRAISTPESMRSPPAQADWPALFVRWVAGGSWQCNPTQRDPTTVTAENRTGAGASRPFQLCGVRSLGTPRWRSRTSRGLCYCWKLFCISYSSATVRPRCAAIDCGSRSKGTSSVFASLDCE
jgi:hypothetical protein